MVRMRQVKSDCPSFAGIAPFCQNRGEIFQIRRKAVSIYPLFRLASLQSVI